MEAYSGLSQVYDLCMDNVPYQDWARRLHQILLQAGIREGLLLDLGCGTGTLTEAMAARGYDMIGVDGSWEMLEKAQEKKRASGRDILYLLQDLRAFELYGTVGAIYSTCDTLNYITEPEELTGVFRLVNTYLDPAGLFCFDFNTEYKYSQAMGEETIAEVREREAFIWENAYDPASRCNRIDLTLFMEGPEGLYRRQEETHIQRGYTLEEMETMLGEAGLLFLEAFDGYTDRPAHPESQRILVLAREQGKKG